MSCVVYLISFEDQTAYVGSTKDLQRRMSQHRHRASKVDNNKYFRPLYCKMRECAYGVSVLEGTTPEDRYICENKWIEDLKPDLNCRLANTGLSKQDYKKKYNEANKEHIKQYYEEHKEYYQAKKLEKITCECGAIVSRNNIAKHKKSLKHLNNI